jgi:hypothetical protein
MPNKGEEAIEGLVIWNLAHPFIAYSQSYGLLPD